MSTYKALLKPTLIAALLVLSLDESQASSPAGTAKTEMTNLRQSSSVLGGGDSTFKGRTKTVVHPMLKPDYPCQNLHVREPTCPSR
jgi:hypothetical protein